MYHDVFIVIFFIVSSDYYGIKYAYLTLNKVMINYIFFLRCVSLDQAQTLFCISEIIKLFIYFDLKKIILHNKFNFKYIFNHNRLQV